LAGDIDAGWYPDPIGAAQLRYWNGVSWTEHTHPPAGSLDGARRELDLVVRPDVIRQPPRRDRRRTFGIAAAIVAGAVFLFAGGNAVISVRDHANAHAPTVTTSPPPSRVTTPPGQTSYAPRLTKNGDPVLVPFPSERESTPRRSSSPDLYVVAAGPTVATPALAKSVTTAIWTRRSGALRAGDYSRLAAFETGAALTVDRSASLCCTATEEFGPVKSMVVAVPRLSQFPARFLAEVSATLNGGPWVALLVVTRVSGGQPWRLSFAGGYVPAHPDDPFLEPLTSADGYAVPMDRGLVGQAVLQPAALAAYWQSWIDHGVAPRPEGNFWMPGFMTDRYGQTKSQDGLQGQMNVHNGLVGRYRYQQDSSAGAYVFPIQPNELLVCAPILRQVTWSGATKDDEPYQPSSRDNWGDQVLPGRYRAIIQDDIASPCIDVAFEDNVVLGAPPDTVAFVPVP
jgi:hypothetical protein